MWQEKSWSGNKLTLTLTRMRWYCGDTTLIHPLKHGCVVIKKLFCRVKRRFLSYIAHVDVFSLARKSRDFTEWNRHEPSFGGASEYGLLSLLTLKRVVIFIFVSDFVLQWWQRWVWEFYFNQHLYPMKFNDRSLWIALSLPFINRIIKV